MNVPTMVRVAALTVLAGVLAACGETPTGAVEQKHEGLRPPYDAAAAEGANLLLGLGDTQTSITVDPNTTEFYRVGAHWIYIPRGAVCRLDSSYGVGEWDKDCASETRRITIPVTVGERNGHALIVFGRDMRFKPTSDPLKSVYLFMREPSLDLRKYAILWEGPGGEWINESVTDPTLRAFRVSGLWVARRVKHFSGYNVSLGFHNEEMHDPTMFGF